MKNKKAAMELSVTAIVILILAIVMLGLGLGFIRGMFSKVATQFEQQIAAEPEPGAPSSSDPITLSRENLIVHSGDAVALKVGIHNPSGVDWTKASFNITCGTSVPTMISNPQFNDKALASGESLTGTYLFQIGKVSEGTHLCEAFPTNNGESLKNYTKDITIKISK